MVLDWCHKRVIHVNTSNQTPKFSETSIILRTMVFSVALSCLLVWVVWVVGLQVVSQVIQTQVILKLADRVVDVSVCISIISNVYICLVSELLDIS